jgi:hypothetical protein
MTEYQSKPWNPAGRMHKMEGNFPASSTSVMGHEMMRGGDHRKGKGKANGHGKNRDHQRLVNRRR